MEEITQDQGNQEPQDQSSSNGEQDSSAAENQTPPAQNPSTDDDESSLDVPAPGKTIEEKKEEAGELHFVFNDRVFKPILPKVFIPGIGERTALEICVDEQAQEYLVKENCVGTVILEVK